MIIGTVTYPSDVEWEVLVTELEPGLHNFTITDGTETVYQDCYIQDVILQVLTVEPIQLGYRLKGVIEPGRELVIAP